LPDLRLLVTYPMNELIYRRIQNLLYLLFFCTFTLVFETSFNKLHTILRFCFALVWFANGFLCKVLDLVPRHQQIVARILGEEHARLFTVLIGISEICMGIWILSHLFPRLNAVMQIGIIAVMNTMEYILAPDLLLWGKFNSLFAFIFICIIAFDHFYLYKQAKEVQRA
jgi:hypothetical protein